MSTADLFILTGAPGSGKTAMLDHLSADVRCVGEPAREILAEQRSRGGAGAPDRDPSQFVGLLLQRSIDKFQAALGWEGSSVFDRGIPDCIAYAVLMGIDPTPSILASETYRYHREVLVFEPWEEIYMVDDERRMSFVDTFAFQEALVDAYERVDYALVEVPRDAVDRRAAFFRSFVTDR